MSTRDDNQAPFDWTPPIQYERAAPSAQIADDHAGDELGAMDVKDMAQARRLITQLRGELAARRATTPPSVSVQAMPPMQQENLAARLLEYATNSGYTWPEYSSAMREASDALHAVTKWSESRAAQQAPTCQGAQQDVLDAARLDFMDGPDFVSLNQYVSGDELYIEVQRENPDGNHRGKTVRAAIDAARTAKGAEGGAA